jgi:hypothetical protein
MVRTEVPPSTVKLEVPSSSRSAMWVVVAVASVWVAVGAVSVFAPDLISGTEQEHVPVAGLLTWLWGGLATGLIVLAASVSDTSTERWRATAITIAIIWAVAAAAGIWSPVLETGTDPTRVPLAAILAPIAATIATAFIAVFAAGARREGR